TRCATRRRQRANEEYRNLANCSADPRTKAMNPSRMTIAIIALLSLWPSALLQAQQRESKETLGSIAGRLTLNGRGLPNLEVALQGTSTAQSVTTDEDGRYRITGLTPGQYSLVPLNSAYVIRSDNRS